MTTLQTGTKVLIEATVIAEDYHDNNLSVRVELPNDMKIWIDPSDLTVCETAEPLTTPSFKAGQIQIPDNDNCKKEVLKITDDVLNDRISLDEFKKQGLEILNKYCPIPAQPTVEAWWKSPLTNELVTILKGIAERHNNGWDLQGYEEILAWHQKHSGRVEVSVPRDEEILDVYDNLAVMPHLTIDQAVIATVRHFMTRKEAK